MQLLLCFFFFFLIKEALHLVSITSETLLNQWGSFISYSTCGVHLENVGSIFKILKMHFEVMLFSCLSNEL